MVLLPHRGRALLAIVHPHLGKEQVDPGFRWSSTGCRETSQWIPQGIVSRPLRPVSRSLRPTWLGPSRLEGSQQKFEERDVRLAGPGGSCRYCRHHWVNPFLPFRGDRKNEDEAVKQSAWAQIAG